MIRSAEVTPTRAGARLTGRARVALRASPRKFLDWTETPRWHEAREVTAAEWGRPFPEQSWVNVEALRILEEG